MPDHPVGPAAVGIHRPGRGRLVVVSAVIVIGAVLLGLSLATDSGDPHFYVWSALLAACWFGGARLGGHLPVAPAPASGRSRFVVHGALPIAVGGGCVAGFAVGALVVRDIPALRESAVEVLERAQAGPQVALVAVAAVTGIAEELFFRGALFTLLRRRPVLITTMIYTAVTCVSGSIMLVFAAAVLGTVTGVLRDRTGGTLGPCLVHLVWTMSMLLILPPLLSAQ